MLDVFPFCLALAGALGAIFGSFITALTHRQRTGQSMSSGRSACPHCHHELAVIDLFPIASYLFLRGKCRYCKKRLSMQYMAIEIATSLLFAGSFWLVWQHTMSHQLLAAGLSGIGWLIVSLATLWTSLVLLVALGIYDYRWGQLPNQWTLGLAAMLLFSSVAAALLNQPILWQPLSPLGTNQELWSTILSGVGAGVFFLAIVYGSEIILKKPGMGMGDVKLSVGLGFLLGFPGIIVGLYLAFIFGAVLSLLLIAGKRKKLGNSIPFGPFMISGAVIALWLTPTITSWYSKLFW